MRSTNDVHLPPDRVPRSGVSDGVIAAVSGVGRAGQLARAGRLTI
jgi:hypothetical protein